MRFKPERIEYKNAEWDAKEAYDNWKLTNKDDAYGLRIFEFAECWANLMEPDLDSGISLSAIADRHCQTADYDGITGYMYGAAVAILSLTWIYGESLRKWHNKEVDKIEGEKANSVQNKVLNPAILTLS